MEIETKDMLETSVEKLNAAASLLERMAAHLEQRATGDVEKIVAEVERPAATEREVELERRLAQAEQQISELRAQESKGASVRKTVPAMTAQLLAKQGITSLESVEAGALDAALTGLSLEQRIAVKSQLLRAGIVG